MKEMSMKAGLMAVVLGLAALPIWSKAQDTDYQTLASSQFAEPKPIGPEPMKVVLGPSGPLEAELANPSIDRRILMVVRGTRTRGAAVVPVSVYWNLPDGSRKLDDQRLLGTVTLLDHFGGKDHTSVIDVTESLRMLSHIKEMPEPQSPQTPSVTLVAPGADDKNSGPQIEEVLLVVSAKPH
jgi:hypothetical protein